MPKYGLFVNGIGKSNRDQKAFDDLVGMDIHSIPGVAYASSALEKDSGETVTELCKAVAVDTDSGNSWWFSVASGKIWKRTLTGTWTLDHTNTTGANLGAEYFNGKIYYASATNLGQYDISGNTWNDSFAAFTNDDAKYKPMRRQHLELYIGDGNLVANVDEAHVFTANALDLQPHQRVTAIEPFKYLSLCIGTIVSGNINEAGIFNWDTFSPSWNTEDRVPERGVNTLITADNNVFAWVGISGNIYRYNGETMTKWRNLRSSLLDAQMANFGADDCATEFYGKSLLQTPQGIYSIFSYDSELPVVLNGEYTNSPGQGVTIGCMTSIGANLLSCWQSGATVGVDEVVSTRGIGIVTAPVAYGEFNNVIVKYDALPAGTSIGIETKINGESWVEKTAITDTVNRKVFFDGGLRDTTTMQARITLNPSTTYTPTIDYIEYE